MWSNADEVKAFIDAHKGGRWEVGDRFVLPDVEQAYEVIAVRPFRRRGKFKLFVDLEAACAVDGCSEYLLTTKEVHQWMKSPHLTRCCCDHRYGFTTPMRDAWKTQEEIASRPMKAAEVKSEPKPKFGVNEQAVLEAMHAMSLVGDRIGVEYVVSHAIDLLPRAGGNQRDTRRQRVVRAIASLAETRRITLRNGEVLL